MPAAIVAVLTRNLRREVNGVYPRERDSAGAFKPTAAAGRSGITSDAVTFVRLRTRMGCKGRAGKQLAKNLRTGGIRMVHGFKTGLAFAALAETFALPIATRAQDSMKHDKMQDDKMMHEEMTKALFTGKFH